MKSKKELKEIAKAVFTEALANAGYSIYEGRIGRDLTPDEVGAALAYLDKYSEAACKKIGTRYYTL